MFCAHQKLPQASDLIISGNHAQIPFPFSQPGFQTVSLEISNSGQFGELSHLDGIYALRIDDDIDRNQRQHRHRQKADEKQGADRCELEMFHEFLR